MGNRHSFPLSGRKLEVISGNYHVYYRIVSSRIEILRIYHGKRKGLF